jgi:hypothetical protein
MTKMRERLQPERRARWSWIKAVLPWLLVAILLVIPLYALAAAFAIRTGVFNLEDKTISNEETRALWAFIAAGLGTAVTLVGASIYKVSQQSDAYSSTGGPGQAAVN